MAERFTSDLVFILIALIVAAAIGYIIGYLCCKAKCAKMKMIPFDAETAKKVFGKKIVENDLTIVEGIGEKISNLLINRNINTWYTLSQTPPAKIKEILDVDGGTAFQMHEPKTWPEQARLAYEGKWAELKEYQNELSGGK